MNLSDTPNPAAKKIMLSHSYKVGEYLDKDKINKESIEYQIFTVAGVESIFAGPGFLTILKKSEPTCPL